MGSTSDLRRQIEIRDQRIKGLEVTLLDKEKEISELRSQLDKFQSVMTSFNDVGKPRKRAMGISAEPQSLINLKEVQELATKKFHVYPKSSR